MKKRFLSLKSSFIPLKMIGFCKNVTCPASQDLLAFQKGETLLQENAEIQRHLELCEFCSIEVELYSRFPQSNETVAYEEMPLPLHQLAEALLSNSHKEFSLFNKLLNESEDYLVNY